MENGKFRVQSIVLEGPEPVRGVEVPLRTGLTALYGLNGSGKTRALEGVAALFGRTDSVRFQFEPDPEAVASWLGGYFRVEPTSESDLVDEIRSSRVEWVAEREGNLFEDSDSSLSANASWRGSAPLREMLGDLLADRWRLTETVFRGQEDGEKVHFRRPFSEILDNSEFHLDGNGNLDLAVRIGPLTPALNECLERLCASWASLLAELPEGAVTADTLDWDLLDRPGTPTASMVFTVLGPLSWPAIESSWDASGDDAWEFEKGEWFEGELDLRWAIERYCSKIRDWLDHGATVRLTGASVGASPLIKVGLDEKDCVALEADLIEEVDLAERTMQVLGGWSDVLGEEDDSGNCPYITRPALEAVGGRVKPAAWMQQKCDEWAVSATELLTDMMPDAPTVRCRLTTPGWRPLLRSVWSACDSTGVEVPLTHLSSAQLRLATMAISLVLQANPGPYAPVNASGWWSDSKLAGESGGSPNIWLLDEPERGLHTLAEEQLSVALDTYAKKHDMAVIVATHSRAFLRNPEVQLIEVFRGMGGHTYSRLVEFPQEARADVLGVNRSDLLQSYQSVLLVEGRHDEVVLGELIGEQLRRRRVLVLPLRGAKNLKMIVDLQILSDTLDVPVTVLIDGVRKEAIDQLWIALDGIPADDEVEANTLCDKYLGTSRPDEEGQIAALALRLHKTRQLRRFQVFGLDRADIIEYLPVESFVSDAESWDELRAQHLAAREAKPKKVAKYFKRYLEVEHKSSFEDDDLRLACAPLSEAPDEMLQLLDRIDIASSAWRT